MSDIEQKVRDVVVESLGVDSSKVVLSAEFVNDLGADSLDTVELIMDLEDVFSIRIPDEDAQNINTVGKAVDYIKAHS